MLKFLKAKYAEAQRQELRSDYESVGDYLSYEEANERQIELLWHDISAYVVRESTGYLEVYTGQIARHRLFVQKEDAEAARDFVKLVADADHRHIASCPKCGSADVQEVETKGYLAYVLELVFLISHRAIANFWLGPKFRCGNCDAFYRVSFRKEAVGNQDKAVP